MKTGIDIQRLCRKATAIHGCVEPISQCRKMIHQLNESRGHRLQSVRQEMDRRGISESIVLEADEHLTVEGHSISKSKVRATKRTAAPVQLPISFGRDKNENVDDMHKMVFEKKFKSYLNHKEQFEERARRRREAIRERRRVRQGAEPVEDYYNDEEVLSNTDSQYIYRDANDMLAACDSLATGKQRKKVELFHAEKFEIAFRLNQFEGLLEIVGEENEGLISKDLLLNYLFDEPMIMMLYSINPYLLGDQISEFETEVPLMLSFQEFSAFLLSDREPTYFEYTEENLEEARKMGRGLKCAPIVGKWIDDSNIYQDFIDLYDSLDMFGSGLVQSAVLANKLRLHAQKARFMDTEVIEIVNINKLVTVRRLIYEIEHQTAEEGKMWTKQGFENYLLHYHRLPTPPKDKLVTRLIMAGKYDTSYIYVVSNEILNFLRDTHEAMEKFAEFFVRKDKFIQNVCKASKYERLKGAFVRSQANQYVAKQTVQQTLVRMSQEADTYIDIEEVLDFFTNRGRPHVIEHKVYLANLQRQLALIDQEELERMRKREEKGDDYISTDSSDEEFERELKIRKINRKKQKLKNLQCSYNKKNFNVTIPVPYQFQVRDKQRKQTKKQSIRERRVREMIEEKRAQELESMKPFTANQVPQHAKENRYEKMVKDQERERLERLQRFRLEIQESMVPMPERLTRPKSTTVHCDFARKPYQFVARPMPWYCEVNLLERVNRKKQQRRERILEEILNRHHDNDLPEGVIRMLERHDKLQEKRRQKYEETEDGTKVTGGGECTFIPHITHHVPDFKAIHQTLDVDLEIARENTKPVTLAPFSFETRERRSKSHNCIVDKDHYKRPLTHTRQIKAEEKVAAVKSTLKHESLVAKRKMEMQEKLQQQEKELQKSEIRRLRHAKFMPQVRRALMRNNNEIAHSRKELEDKMKQVLRQQKANKRKYEEQMLNIYAKVWKKPLLIETGQFPNVDIQKNPRLSHPPPQGQIANKDSQLKNERQPREKRAIKNPPYQVDLLDHGLECREQEAYKQYIAGELGDRGLQPFQSNDEDDQDGFYLQNTGIQTH